MFFQTVAGDLMIRNIQLNHAGKYVCIVNTDVESLSAAADLIVKGKKMHLELTDILRMYNVIDLDWR